tara:strand:+ start:116 stop:217 length:102 start_codon:yes stop_codon:yes gene_type:complete
MMEGRPGDRAAFCYLRRKRKYQILVQENSNMLN